MHWFMIPFFIVFFGIALCNVIAPEATWRRTRAWQYKNPGAAEPSAAAFKVQRISGAVAIVVGVVILVVTLSR
ncbi:DUF6199 family natural product biosynthesis protein [Allobranchiibius sp. GilTou38]|uniref:DUF6199 family natural product biosynthesis protein n=1 Tax=Allobranchiibius sp. GilTou38 TaxID=2815210 RepID=UPI001AA11FBF|nr:DUF6199 family natural product biosynthesis protein [Allobranchiibius sp. GilTou38]MBO1765902.1 hypothetical protein [Allobranchiibius sp. GilTou38]